MHWFTAFYLFCVVFGFLPRLFINDPFFLFAAPPRIWMLRLKALLSPKESFSVASRCVLLFRWCLLLFDQALWHMLWNIDDIFFSAYREIDLTGSVFIVGGFRTGSTSLHRTLALDRQRFVSPRMLEVVYPFLIVHLFLDFLEWSDEHWGTRFIASVDELYKRVCGPELLARHPMSYYEAEEDDLLFAINYGVGWYSAIQFPSSKVWMDVGQLSKFPKPEHEQLFTYYKRVMQKVLWRRGHGRILLSKSHLIEFVQNLSDHIPDAKFVDLVRHPKDSFVSWLALQQAGSRVFARGAFPIEEAVQAHLRFWELFFAKEMEYFNQDGIDKRTRVQLTFKEYCLGPDKVVKQLYALWDFPFHMELQKALSDYKKEHDSYKQMYQYRNPSLEELGLSLQQIENRYETYIEKVGVGAKQPVSPPFSPRG